MIEPRLTEQAEADLDGLWAYIAADNPDAADRLVDAVLESSRMHARFPGMGLNREDFRAGGAELVRGHGFHIVLGWQGQFMVQEPGQK